MCIKVTPDNRELLFVCLSSVQLFRVQKQNIMFIYLQNSERVSVISVVLD